MNRVMWGQCVYMDNGSSFFHIIDNVYKDGDDFNVKINSGSHNIHVKGIYSNKKQDLIGKTGCYNNTIDSTNLFSAANRRIVEKIRSNAGAYRWHRNAWENFPDLRYFEAENACLNGGIYSTAGIGTQVYGYSGTGFLSGFNRQDKGSAIFNINSSKPRIHKLTIRYSSINISNVELWLSVNGEQPQAVHFKPTEKDKWSVVSHKIQLKKGLNNIVLMQRKKAGEGFYLDNISVTTI